jgi:hypothetical protein
MSNKDIENDRDYEPVNEFDTQVPQGEVEEERQELSQEELDLMDVLEHKNSPTLVMDFKKDKRKKAKHTYDKEKGPAPVDYFAVTLPEDPEYERWYRVTSKKLRRAILSRYLPKDKTRLEITRVGSGKSTIHRIREVHDNKVLVITNDKDYFEEVPLQQKSL